MFDFCKAIIHRHLSIFYQNLNNYFNGLFLFIVLIASLAFIENDLSVNTIFCFILIIGVIIASINSSYLLTGDYKRGIVAQLLSLGENKLEVFILIKICVHTVTQLLVMMPIFPVIMLFFSLDTYTVLKFSTVYSILLFFINLFLSFSTILNLSLGKSNLGVLLVLPFLFPMIIIAILSVSNFSYYILLAGILLIAMPIIIMCCKVMLKIAINYD